MSFISAKNHAGYFPNSKELVIKTLFSPKDGRILGAQVFGEEGVDKRIDVISTLMNFKGSAKDLAGLDLAYAPPFGSAKDPLHIVAFTILNSLEGRPTLLPPGSDLSSFQVIDVRTSSELEKMPLPNAMHLPIDRPPAIFTEKILKLDKKIKTVVACHSGKRAHVIASKLISLGFSEVYNLTGGMMIRSRISN